MRMRVRGIIIRAETVEVQACTGFTVKYVWHFLHGNNRYWHSKTG